MSVDITVVPSKFAWRTSTRKRPPPSAIVFSPKKSKRRLVESFTEELVTVSSDITSEADDTVSLKTAEIVKTESQEFMRVVTIPVVTLLKRKLRG